MKKNRSSVFTKFLLTRLCEARLIIVNGKIRTKTISTHAPLRGATFTLASDTGRKTISTHAPLRGATPLSLFCSAMVAFLLTRLCEARHDFHILRSFSRNFYSRASARRDKFFHFL